MTMTGRVEPVKVEEGRSRLLGSPLLPVLDRIRCKGNDPKTGRACRNILLEVEPDHRKMVLARVRLYCTDCKLEYSE